MIRKSHERRFVLWKKRWIFVFFPVFLFLTVGVWHAYKPLPDGLNFCGPARPVAAGDVRFLSDLTANRTDGEGRWVRQEIFDTAIAMIGEARTFVLADFFLLNEFAGGAAGEEPVDRPLSARFADALIEAREHNPELTVVLITDPLNTIYGAVEQEAFTRMRAAGVEVVMTDVRRLRDGNVMYSPFWRVLLQWWGNSSGSRIPNPLGDGTVGLPSLLEMLNFKANHRKVLVTDNAEGEPRGLVTSANPHSGSALHGNVALLFGGGAAIDLLRTEAAVYRFSTGRDLPEPMGGLLRNPTDASSSYAAEGLYLRVISERAIERELLALMERSGAGDGIDAGLFYFSDLRLRRALAAAAGRGAEVRLLLDPNKDAFGRAKNGIPNRQTGAYLYDRDVKGRWYRTGGEQFHTKMALFRRGDGRSSLVLGSANWTRRNLRNLNLETNVVLHGPDHSKVFQDAASYFETVWGDPSPRNGTHRAVELKTGAPFQLFEDRSWFRRIGYLLMEALGAGTF